MKHDKIRVFTLFINLRNVAMPEKPTATIHRQLLEILSQLPLSSQEEVLDFAISLQKKKLTQHWDAISDVDAAALKTEFANEDLTFAESVLTDYLSQLQQEDVI
ncbi:hypothetical protein ANSO36C_21810 [Nostoc cf. commune SO-36]|uniref:Programmed cell death antitoxin YdcD n=1 Tax=Nostoc cf. commune SO-36 TaxID=449208 RepID=A0ABM7Z099_NOSCO|nr:hypothetical protein [Nostoc commune]BDI16379.1 hypothetical protein ANSO36C_21810 [Nostoc cf. commune SO-36]